MSAKLTAPHLVWFLHLHPNNMRTRLLGPALLASLLASGLLADDSIEHDARLRFGSISLYTENDKFFAGTDRNYTNGFKLTALSSDLRAFNSPEVPRRLRALADALDPLVPTATPKLGLSLGTPQTQGLFGKPFGPKLIAFERLAHHLRELSPVLVRLAAA